MLTREEIAAMPAGPKMNELIAEHVLGKIWVHTAKTRSLIDPEDWPVWQASFNDIQMGKGDESSASSGASGYSTDANRAWVVVEAMQQRGGFIKLQNGCGGDTKGWRAELIYRGSFYDPHLCPTAPLAICRAALLALLEATSLVSPQTPETV